MDALTPDTLIALSPTYCVNALLATLNVPLVSFLTIVVPSTFTARLIPPSAPSVKVIVLSVDVTAPRFTEIIPSVSDTPVTKFLATGVSALSSA